jgi:protease I
MIGLIPIQDFSFGEEAVRRRKGTAMRETIVWVGVLSAIGLCLALGVGCPKKEGEPGKKPEPGPAQAGPAAGAGKVLMVIAHEGFRDEELLVPKRILEENGFEVVVASTSLDPAKGMLKAEVKPDILLHDADVTAYAAVVFVGGVGAQGYYANEDALRLARDAVGQGKVTGAICLATAVLAKAGVVKGKTVTGWPSKEHERLIEQGGATYAKKDVLTDGKIVTASGPEAARAFGNELVRALKE